MPRIIVYIDRGVTHEIVVRPEAPPAVEAGATIQRTGTFYAGGAGAIYAAVNAAQTGDVILVNPGVYAFDKVYIARSVTIKAAIPAQRPVLQAVAPLKRRFIDIAADVSLTLDGLDLRGDKTGGDRPSDECVGVYSGGGTYTLTVRNCCISEFGTGVMVGDHPAGVVLLEDNEFADNGNYNGMTHNLYIGAGRFTMRRCLSHATKKRSDYGAEPWRVSWGHLVKTRSAVVLIEDCKLLHRTGEMNRCIDASNGGDVTILRTQMEMNAGNMQIINDGGSLVNYGVEEAPGQNPLGLTRHRFTMEDCTLVNHAMDANDCQYLRIQTAYLVNGVESWSVKRNVFAGFVGAMTAGTAGYDPSPTDNTMIARADLDRMMPGHASFDFTLVAPPVVEPPPPAPPPVSGATVVNGVWTPQRDAAGQITDASWADLPIGEVVEWSGTAFESQLSPPYGITSGTFRDLNPHPYGTRAIFDADSGGEMDKATGRMWVMGGGHGDGSNNGLYQFDCRSGKWSIPIPPTPQEMFPPIYAAQRDGSQYNHGIVSYPSGMSYGHFPEAETPAGDGKPAAYHTYRGLVYCNGVLVRVRNHDSAYWHARVDDAMPRWEMGGPQAAAFHPDQHAIAKDGIVYWGRPGDGDNTYWTVRKYNPATKAEAGAVGFPSGSAYWDYGGTYSAPLPGDKWFVAVPAGYGVNNVWSVLNLTSGGTYAKGSLSGAIPGPVVGACADYVDALGKVIVQAPNNAWTLIDPATGACDATSIVDPYGKTAAAWGQSVAQTWPRINGRMRYWPARKCVVWLPRTFSNAIVVRLG